ncbi:MAG: hypothetical protein H7248_10445 [Microbacteriaceae bacterium]|nr:hypothetical protein [Microbacteriaceae bacterium]
MNDTSNGTGSPGCSATDAVAVNRILEVLPATSVRPSSAGEPGTTGPRERGTDIDGEGTPADDGDSDDDGDGTPDEAGVGAELRETSGAGRENSPNTFTTNISSSATTTPATTTHTLPRVELSHRAARLSPAKDFRVFTSQLSQEIQMPAEYRRANY